MINWRDIEILKTVGSGNFGEVKKARLRKKVVAVKVLKKSNNDSQEKLKAMKLELAVMIGIHHPNVLSLIAVVSDADKIGIVTPYAVNGSLMDYCKQIKQPSNKVSWLSQMLTS